MKKIIRRSNKTLRIWIQQFWASKHIAFPLFSRHGKNTVTTADFIINFAPLCSSKSLTAFFAYPTSSKQFQMVTIFVKLLKSPCRDHDHLAEIIFHQTRDNKVAVFIGGDAFMATIPKKFITGNHGLHYGFNTIYMQHICSKNPKTLWVKS